MKRNHVAAGLLSALFILFLASGASAETNEPPADGSDSLTAWNWIMQERFAKDTNALVRPGLLALRGERAVYVLARWTELSPGEPVEFILIGPESGHDYEALAVSVCAPRDVRAGLEFIGVPPGNPVDYTALQLWPRGERIATSMLTPYAPALGSLTGAWANAESFILSDAVQGVLPEQGFVFTGSAPDPEGTPTHPLYTADTGDPYSIISLYNESRSLLDVPRLAPQGPVYGTQRLNPDQARPVDTPLLVRLVPLPPADGSRSVELAVRATPVNSSTQTEVSFVFEVTNQAGETLLEEGTLQALLALFGKVQAEGHDLYITLLPDSAMRVADAHRLFTFFEQINTTDGARLSPAGEDELYYKAFLPNPRFADRTQRPNQPWELHLDRDAEGRRTGRLDLIEESWTDEAPGNTYDVQSFRVDTPDALKETLEAHPDHLKVLFIYGELTCGEAQRWSRAARPEIRTVYFYPAD
ncbi:MAG: hypothetical protein PHP44_03770 [Kiritimatiellae bacterium]|nr:hypothetical protein [Kiritimatiellia bacterium]